MKKLLYIMIFAWLFVTTNAHALQVIPNLYGFGTDTRASYGNSTNPVICVVTNLNATTGDPGGLTANEPDGTYTRGSLNVAQGSFTQCVEDWDHDNKLIVFEVSGPILDQSAITITNNYIHIAGQTAPAPGIELRGAQLQINSGYHDILVQHIRVRAGDEETGVDRTGTRSAVQVFNESSPGYNIVFDHCSFSWAPDTVFDLAYAHDVTVANTIISEGLNNSWHVKGAHSNGLLLGFGSQNISIIQNLLAHNSDRNPYVNNISGLSQANTIMIANNVAYNPGFRNGQWAEDSGNYSDAFIYVGNVSVSGYNSYSCADNDNPCLIKEQNNSNQFYIDDNKIDDTYNGNGTDTQDDSSDWDHVNATADDKTNCKDTTLPVNGFNYPTSYTPMASTAVEEYVKNNVGAFPTSRTEVDARIINEWQTGTGQIIDYITQQNPAAACYPNCVQNAEEGWGTVAQDTNTFSPPASPHVDAGSGYTNLEVYLQGLATGIEGEEPAAPEPDPMTWETEPAAASTTSISMEGTTCSDATPPIEYNFDFDTSSDDCGSDADIGTGGTDSGWQSNDPTYTDSGLQVNQVYCYTAQARDSDVPTSNTATSSVKVYTLADTPLAPTMTDSAVDVTVQILLQAITADNNPDTNPTTQYAVYVVTSAPNDSTWQGKYVDTDGTPSATPVWQSKADWANTEITGLNSGTNFGFQSIAKNEDGVLTANSTTANYSTVSPPGSGENETFVNITLQNIAIDNTP